MKKHKDLEVFLNQLVQVHVRTTTIKHDENGEGMMSNIFEGFLVKLSEHFIFMGNIYQDSDKFDVTAVIDLNDISAITLAEEEIPDFLLELPGEDEEIH